MTQDSLTGQRTNSPVVGTYSIADGAVGVHGGGPLFADGTVGGNVTVNFALFGENGQTIFKLEPLTWEYASDPTGMNPNPGILLTYDVQFIKGYIPPQVLPDPFQDWAPITQGPERITDDLLIRVTLNS